MLCEQIPELEVIKAFNSPEVLLSELSTLDFDLCILDIEMPQMNGLQVANLLNQKPVIFITAYKEYAVEAFDLDAVDYICKPIKKERLQQAVQKALKRLNTYHPVKSFFQWNTHQGKSLIFFDRLGYIKTSEIDSRDKVILLVDGTTIILKNISFDQLKGILPPYQFCRINKKEIIALKIVQLFSFDEIKTSMFNHSGKPLTLTLSEVYRDDFIKKVKI
jgi:DNA-binding LytR/AlgR family response regulator